MVLKQTSLFKHFCPAGEAEDDRQAGGHQSEAERWDGPLQEDNGQALAQSPWISERKGVHAGGMAVQINMLE